MECDILSCLSCYLAANENFPFITISEAVLFCSFYGHEVLHGISLVNTLFVTVVPISSA